MKLKTVAIAAAALALAVGMTACGVPLPGLRHPASAALCLRLAGRGPNSDSLFPPLAAVVVVAPNEGRPWHSARYHLQIAKSARHLNEMPGVAFYAVIYSVLQNSFR